MEEQGRLAGVKRALAAEFDSRFVLLGQCGVLALLGFTMAGARVMEDGAPFGMAMVACAGAGLGGASALLGAALGYLLFYGLEVGIRYVASAVLVYTIAFVFQEVSIYKSPAFMPMCAALVMALTGFLSSFSITSDNLPLLAKLFMETVLAFGGTYFFHEALSNQLHTTETGEIKHSAAIMVLLGCILIALSRIVVFDTLSVGRFLALLLVMTSAMKGGMLTGAAVGTVLGLAMDISSPGIPFYTMAYAFSGLLSGVFGKHGKVIFVISFILGNALAVVCAWSSFVFISALFETFCASVVFMLLPSQLLVRLGVMLQYTERGSGESGLRRFAAARLSELSGAYTRLYEIVRRNVEEPYNDANIAKVFDRAADQVCVRCPGKNRCWNAEYIDTLSAMNDATRAMVENGSLSVENIPEYFAAKCKQLPAFVSAVNGELRGIAYRRQYQMRLIESRNVAWAQYSDMAEILSQVARELGSVNGSDPLTERRLLRFLRSMDIDGDAAVYRDGGGRLHVTVSSARLSVLLSQEDYLEKLSSVVGSRLCLEGEPEEKGDTLRLLEAEPLAVSVGIAALKKRGEKVSGDRGTYFKTDAGVLCVILSDGMGTGDEAAKDSSQVVDILEKFLRSGIDPASAMKLLNSVMLLRAGDSWGYATVDLMCVNLFSGETCFYKYGAAPSYVISSKGIRRIKGEKLAAGLSTGEGLAPDTVRMRLRPGCTALIATDGVIAGSDDGWLRSLLKDCGEDMRELAKAALNEAEKVYGANDDMTVIAVRVEERA